MSINSSYPNCGNAKVARDKFLPFALVDLDETEVAEIQNALDSGWITTGPKTQQFEAEFASNVGVKHAIAVNSCTAAMHLALEAIGMRRGDEVITTPYTFVATAEVIRYFDAKPVFVDIDSDSLNIDPALVERAITGKTKVILPVHLGGLPCQLDVLYSIADRRHLSIVEDAAHAFPARYKDWTVGNGRDIVCFSFYATKPITTGEGGMICTNNDSWAERCRIMSLHGISKDAWKRYSQEGSWFYEIVAPGYKYNMTDVAAAMGLAQLRKSERMWRRRSAIAASYTDAFKKLPELETSWTAENVQHAWHLYMLRLNLDRLNIDRNRFVEELKIRNIGVSVHFIPLHIHPYYRETFGYRPEDFPVAYREYLREISLPIYSKMTDADVQDVIDAVLNVIKRFRA